jgi:hypothetical protein
MPIKEYRPSVVPLSTLSRRVLAPIFLSFRKADTGVSKSAGNSLTITFRLRVGEFFEGSNIHSCNIIQYSSCNKKSPPPVSGSGLNSKIF